jgi:hypothetical protein
MVVLLLLGLNPWARLLGLAGNFEGGHLANTAFSPLPFPLSLFVVAGNDTVANLTSAFQRIAAQLSSLNANQVVYSLTPSEACGSKNGEGAQKYSRMCEALGIKLTADASKPIFESTKFPSYRFAWNSTGKVDTNEVAKGVNADKKVELDLERSSYKPTVDYLAENDLHVYDISEGSYCPAKLIFNVVMHSVRKHLKSPSHQPETLLQVGKLSGRSDLVVLFEEVQGGILRDQVRFLIEIKTVSAMAQGKEELCNRNAITQTVGMSIANPSTSPPVILTNLSGKHKVFYIESTEATECDPKKYKLFAQNCSSFSSAVAFAYLRSEERADSSSWANSMVDFGRGPTPPSSVEEEEGSAEILGEFEEGELDEQDLKGFANNE